MRFWCGIIHDCAYVWHLLALAAAKKAASLASSSRPFVRTRYIHRPRTAGLFRSLQRDFRPASRRRDTRAREPTPETPANLPVNDVKAPNAERIRNRILTVSVTS